MRQLSIWNHSMVKILYDGNISLKNNDEETQRSLFTALNSKKKKLINKDLGQATDH